MSSVVQEKPNKRTASKAARRAQLIQATIRSIANDGLADTTIATVASEAGVSQGLINLHFQSKERLLLETLRYVADEYKETWEKALESAGADPRERLEALLAVDYHKSIFDRNKIAVWIAFWSETKSRPVYRKLCAERDRGYTDMLSELVSKIIEEGGYQGLDSSLVSNGLAAMAEGLWLDLLVNPKEMNQSRARSILHTYLCSLFPKHFSSSKED